MKKKNVMITSIALGVVVLAALRLLFFGKNGQQRRMKLKRSGKQLAKRVRETIAEGDNI